MPDDDHDESYLQLHLLDDDESHQHDAAPDVDHQHHVRPGVLEHPAHDLDDSHLLHDDDHRRGVHLGAMSRRRGDARVELRGHDRAPEYHEEARSRLLARRAGAEPAREEGEAPGQERQDLLATARKLVTKAAHGRHAKLSATCVGDLVNAINAGAALVGS